MNPVQRVRGQPNDVELQNQYGLFDRFYLQDLAKRDHPAEGHLQNQYGLFDWLYLQNMSRMNPVQRVRGAPNDVELQNQMSFGLVLI